MLRIKIAKYIVQLIHPAHFNGTSVLFLPGLPMSLRDNPVFDILEKQGFAVFYPFYSGTYDSTGKFSPKQCIEDARILGEEIRKTDKFIELYFNKKIPLNTRRLILVGHSFGASIALLADNGLFDAKVLLSPILQYSEDKIKKSKPNTQFGKQMLSLIGLLKNGYSKTYMMGSEGQLEKFLFGKNDTELLISLQNNSVPTLIIHGKKDVSYPWEAAAAAIKEAKSDCMQAYPKNVGHSLSSYDKKTADTIGKFIANS